MQIEHQTADGKHDAQHRERRDRIEGLRRYRRHLQAKHALGNWHLPAVPADWSALWTRKVQQFGGRPIQGDRLKLAGLDLQEQGQTDAIRAAERDRSLCEELYRSINYFLSGSVIKKNQRIRIKKKRMNESWF